MSSAAFDPADLAIMQSVFDEVCTGSAALEPERRMEIATAIFQAYSMGERDRKKLQEVARRAAK